MKRWLLYFDANPNQKNKEKISPVKFGDINLLYKIITSIIIN